MEARRTGGCFIFLRIFHAGFFSPLAEISTPAMTSGDQAEVNNQAKSQHSLPANLHLPDPGWAAWMLDTKEEARLKGRQEG